MLEFLYQTGWGALTIMLLFQIPFLLVFFAVLYRKLFSNPSPSDTPHKRLARLEGLWIAAAVVLFVGVNLLSIRYMPMVATAQAAKSEQPLQEVAVTARSWAFELSERNLVVGQPVRFTARSADTMHSFSVYHPDGKVLFTMQLMPGVSTPAEIIHTFTEPGTYPIRCLEYCGIAHHGMQDALTVAQRSE